MIGEVLDGLAGAALGARLRQRQRKLGRTVKRVTGRGLRRVGVGCVGFGRFVFAFAFVLFAFAFVLGLRTVRLRGVGFARRFAGAGERGARGGDAVIVLEPVRQKQRAARLLLGILGERNGRRPVGNDVERPDQIVAGALQRRRAGGVNLEAEFLGADRRLSLLRRHHAALADDGQIELA